jgi:RES domain-containing protein
MAKLPLPPSVEEIRRTPPKAKLLPAGTVLARIYFAGGDHPTQWNTFRNFGPGNARFDHHLPNADGKARFQQRSIFYCAAQADTCLAEVFQDTRRIDRFRNAPWLAVFELDQECRLLDLAGAYTTRVGASMALNTGNRRTARVWAQRFYDAYEDLMGIYYASSMHGNAPAIVLTDRAEKISALPAFPKFNRALADDALLDVLKHSANTLGYGLR